MFINSEVIVKSIIDPDNIDLSFSLSGSFFSEYRRD